MASDAAPQKEEKAPVVSTRPSMSRRSMERPSERKGVWGANEAVRPERSHRVECAAGAVVPMFAAFDLVLIPLVDGWTLPGPHSPAMDPLASARRVSRLEAATAWRLAHLFTLKMPQEVDRCPQIGSKAPLSGGFRFVRADAKTPGEPIGFGVSHCPTLEAR